MSLSRHRLAFLIFALALLVGTGTLYAQLDGADRGIPPVDSTSNFEVLGVEVDVTADSAEKARLEGWRQAQGKGWKMLWSNTTGRPASQAPNLSDSVLNGIVSGIIVESEQIGPRRYIARLGVLFDRARTGEMLGVQGFSRRSAPLLVIPVMVTGSTPYSFEFRNQWQRTWAQFRTASSPIDYVRTSGAGADPLLLNAAQTQRRGRGWWRMLLDQYGAADVVVPHVHLRQLFPGGPAQAVFTAYQGPDHRALGRFVLRAPNGQAVPAMLEEGLRRIDLIYRRAFEEGLLRPDPDLVIIAPPAPPIEIELPDEVPIPTAPLPSQPVPTGAPTTFQIQVPTADEGAIQQAEIGVSRIGGVTSALTVSRQPGGTSTMRVTFAGDAAAFQSALQAQGWQVQVTSANALRISR